MGTGTLEERITVITNFRHTAHGDETVISLEHIKQILDEARREFHDLVDHPYPKPKEMRKLVKKWLG